MLSYMRSPKFVKGVMHVILWPVIITFVFAYGFSSRMNRDQTGLDWYAKGEIGGREFLLEREQLEQAADDLGAEIRGQLQDSQLPGSELRRLVDNPSRVRRAIELLALQRLVRQYQFEATDREVQQNFSDLIEASGRSKNELIQYLTYNYGSLKFYEAEMRRQLQLSKARDLIMENVRPSLYEIWDQYVMANQEIAMTCALFESSAYLDQVQATTDTLEQYYQEHKEQYRTGRQARYRYLILRRSELLPRTDPPAADVEAFYKQNSAKPGDLFWRGREVRVRQIQLNLPADADTTATAEVERRMEDIAAQLREDGGTSATFARLADEFSEDPRNELEGVKQGGLIPFPITENYASRYGEEFKKLALSLEAGAWGGPVRSDAGLHLIRVEQIEPAGPEPFEEVRAAAAGRVKDQIGEREYLLQARKLTELWDTVTTLDDLAQASGLSLGTTDWVNVGASYIPEIGFVSDLNAQIAQLNLNAISGVMTSPYYSSFYLVLQPIEFREDYLPAFQEIRGQVDNDYTARASARLAIDAGRDFLQSIAPGEWLTSQPLVMNFTLKEVAPFKRHQPDPNDPRGFRPGYAQELNQHLLGFDVASLEATTGTLGLSYLGDDIEHPDGCCVWQITRVGPVDRDRFEELLPGIRTGYQSRIGRILLREFLTDARKQANVEINTNFAEQ